MLREQEMRAPNGHGGPLHNRAFPERPEKLVMGSGDVMSEDESSPLPPPLLTSVFGQHLAENEHEPDFESSRDVEPVELQGEHEDVNGGVCLDDPNNTPAHAVNPTACAEPPPVPHQAMDTSVEEEESTLCVRNSICEEILQTETRYVADLRVLCNSFLHPLRDGTAWSGCQTVMTARVLSTVFSNAETILNCNERFLKELSTRMAKGCGHPPEDGHATCLGDVFRQFAPYFKMYKSYVNNYDMASALLKRLTKENKKLNRFLTVTSQLPQCKGLFLTSFLIMPIQRIPRYRLLLGELAKNTPPAHEDWANLKAALEEVETVATSINKHMHEMEERDKVLQVQKQLVGYKRNLVAAHRIFVKSGDLTKVCRKDDRVYRFFLFNDVCLYAERTKMGRFKVHRELSLREVALRDIPDGRARRDSVPVQLRGPVTPVNTKANTAGPLATLASQLSAALARRRSTPAVTPVIATTPPMRDRANTSVPSRRTRRASVQDRPYHYAWELLSPQRSFVVLAANAVEKKEWLSALKACLEQLKGDGITRSDSVQDVSHAPVWQADNEAAECQLCATRFTHFRRRHHCRICGRVVCNDCSKARWRMDTRKGKQRACDECEQNKQHNQDMSMSELDSTGFSASASDFTPDKMPRLTPEKFHHVPQSPASVRLKPPPPRTTPTSVRRHELPANRSASPPRKRKIPPPLPGKSGEVPFRQRKIPPPLPGKSGEVPFRQPTFAWGSPGGADSVNSALAGLARCMSHVRRHSRRHSRNLSGSFKKVCAVSECSADRVGGKPYCSAHLNGLASVPE